MKKALLTLFCTAICIALTMGQHPSIGGYDVYYGHLHNHTDYSDGKGTPWDAFNYARHEAGLDFMGVSDHVEALSKKEYNRTKQAASECTVNGEFVAFHGFEWSSVRYGHVTVVNSPDRIGSGAWLFASFLNLVNDVKKRDCIAFFNHPGEEDRFGTEFSHFKKGYSEKFVGMELWNGTKDFKAYYYTDGFYKNDGGKGFFDEAIERGWKIGAAGSEDNHSDNWGHRRDYRLAILSPKLTKADLYSALKQRRFFSTLDKNLSMSFKINGNEMGSFISDGNHDIRIELKDNDGEAFTKVELLKNFVVVKTWNVNEKNPVLTYSDNGNVNDYYYVRCKQADGDEAISSPIYVTTSRNAVPKVPVAETPLTELKSTEDEKDLIIEEHSKELNFVIYPNPTSGESVKIHIEHLKEEVKLMVVDINGRAVVNKNVSENTVLLPGLNSGLYFVQISGRNFFKTEILIIK